MADPMIDDVQRAFLLNAGPLGLNDDQIATVVIGGATSQATALRVSGRQINITKANANAAIILPSIFRGEAAAVYVVHNNTLVSVTIGAAPGDKMNTVATTATLGAGSVALASKTSGIFVVSSTPTGKHGSATASPNNWWSFIPP